jgi:hypothetical protein
VVEGEGRVSQDALAHGYHLVARKPDFEIACTLEEYFLLDQLSPLKKPIVCYD